MSAVSQPQFPNFTKSENDDRVGDSYFDVEFANSIAKLESYNKHLYRPNTYLHKWWARRCGSTFRLILKYLVEDSSNKDYYSGGGLEGKLILDPMMGGGTTLHEAIRMGANVIGADIDPIPLLQVRASLTDVPQNQLEESFEEFFSTLSTDLGSFYHTNCPECNREVQFRFVLYGLKQSCDCRDVIAIDSHTLRHEMDGTAIRICPESHAIVNKNTECHTPINIDKPLIVEKGTKICNECGSKYRDDHDRPYYSRYTPLVLVSECQKHGMTFSPISQSDVELIQKADKFRKDLFDESRTNFLVKDGPKSSDLLRRKIFNYLDLFSSRQLLYLHKSKQILREFEPIIRLNFALLVSTSIEFNSMLCGYKGGDKRRPGAIRHVFSHHAYTFPYTSVENNPLYSEKVSGTLQSLFHNRIRRAREWANTPRERFVPSRKARFVKIDSEKDLGIEVDSVSSLLEGTRRFHLIQGSSTSLDLDTNFVDHIVTDPPYFDSVQYSDLASFFRVWLEQLLFGDVKWHYDHNFSAVNPQRSENDQYLKILSGIFKECHRVIKKDKGRLVFTFHHWNPKAWRDLTISLKRSNFLLLDKFIVHSENPVSVHISNLKALTHDAIMIFNPIETGETKKWDRVLEVDKSDSERFTNQCAKLLGWMLSSDISEPEVTKLWTDLLGGK